jgi:hypothetical protein
LRRSTSDLNADMRQDLAISHRVVALPCDQAASFELGVAIQRLSRGAQRAPIDVAGPAQLAIAQ